MSGPLIELTQDGVDGYIVVLDGVAQSTHATWHRAVVAAVAFAQSGDGEVAIVIDSRVLVKLRVDDDSDGEELPDPVPDDRYAYAQIAQLLGGRSLLAGDINDGVTLHSEGGPAEHLSGFLALDGKSGCIDSGFDGVFAYDGAHTLVWFERTDGEDQNDHADIISKGNESYRVRVGRGGKGSRHYRLRDAPDARGGTVDTASDAVKPNVWHMFAARYTGTMMQLLEITAGGVKLLGEAEHLDGVNIESNERLLVGARSMESGTIIDRHWRGHVTGTWGFAHALSDGDLQDLSDAAGARSQPSVPEPEPDPQPDPPSGSFGSGGQEYGLRGSKGFSDTSRRLKNGAAFTSAMNRYYDAFLTAFLGNENIDRYGHVLGSKTFRDPGSYAMGRSGAAVAAGTPMQVFRLTGDLRILDRVTEGYELARPNLRTEWDLSRVGSDHGGQRSMCGARWSGSQWTLPSGAAPPWSPYQNWNYRGTVGKTGAGSDTLGVQNFKPWAFLCEYAYALHVNRDLTSPAGYRYGDLADWWMVKIFDNLKAWSENTSACWAQNYLGRYGGNGWGSGRNRAKWGEWPVFLRGEQHVIFDDILLQHYYGLFGQLTHESPLRGVPNPAGAHTAARQMVDRYVAYGLVPCLDPLGKPRLIPRRMALLASPPWRSSGNHPSYSTYTGGVARGMTNLFLTGHWPHAWTREMLMEVARSYLEMHNPDGSVKGNLASGHDRVGHGLDVRLISGSERRASNNARSAYCAMLIWEEGDALDKIAETVQNEHGGGYGRDAMNHNIPASQFIRHAFKGIGVT